MCWKAKNLNKTALGFWIVVVDLLKVHEEVLGWTLGGQEKLDGLKVTLSPTQVLSSVSRTLELQPPDGTDSPWVCNNKLAVSVNGWKWMPL